MSDTWSCRATVIGDGGCHTCTWVVRGRGRPDIASVDAVARAMLSARRLGYRLQVVSVTSALGELLVLAGLVVEVEREPEGGKEPLGIEEAEEEAEPPDPSA